MIIKNGFVFVGDTDFNRTNIRISNGRIAEIDAGQDAGEEIIDAEGMYVIPGLTDIHFHGCMGHDFSEGTSEAVSAIADYQLSVGVTTICPATMSYDEKRLMKICRAARDYDNESGSSLIGINMEGPFISYDKRGAQNPDYIVNPDIDMFRRLYSESGGHIRLVDIAPETEGAMEFIKEVSGDVHVSIAHTCADYDTAMKAFELGADHVTHLYNAMPPFNHRAPGVIGAAFDCESAYVEIIGDGIHCEPAAIRTALKAVGDDRLVLISDSMEACGLVDGEYSLGGQRVFVKGRIARLADGTIAGSVTNLMDCLRTIVNSVNIPLRTAVKLAAVNPAKSIGIYDSYGSIEPGKVANIVLLDNNLNVRHVIKNGLSHSYMD